MGINAFHLSSTSIEICFSTPTCAMLRELLGLFLFPSNCIVFRITHVYLYSSVYMISLGTMTFKRW